MQPPPPFFYLSACQQDVTVPALSRSSLSLQLSPSSLLHNSASLFCELYFPYLPPKSASFFLLPLFPFSHPPQHDITLALTHYQCRKLLLSYVPRWRLIMSGHCRTLSRWRYSALRGCRGEAALQERRIGAICASGDIGVLWEGRGQSVMSERAIEKA